MSMQMKYHPELDAAWISGRSGPSVRTVTLSDCVNADYDSVNADYDSEGQLYAVEVQCCAAERYGLNGSEAQARATELVAWVRQQHASRAR